MKGDLLEGRYGVIGVGKNLKTEYTFSFELWNEDDHFIKYGIQEKKHNNGKYFNW